MTAENSRMGDTQTHEIVLRPSKRKISLYLLACLGFVAAGAVSRNETGVMAWLCVLFFGLGAVVFAIQLAPGASYLRISSEGFSFCSLFRKSPLILWRDVSSFRTAAVPPSRHRMVVFDWHAKPKTGLRQINRQIAGATDGLPDSYGLRPEELAELLNAWRSRAPLDK